MKLDPEETLNVTFWILIAFWAISGIGLLVLTGKPIFAILYLIALGPMLTLIYHTAKTEMMTIVRKRKQLHKTHSETPPDQHG